jgi:hypothetical protein
MAPRTSGGVLHTRPRGKYTHGLAQGREGPVKDTEPTKV